MNINKWLKDRLVAVSIAMTNVQKSVLGQQKEDLATGNSNQERKQSQTNLMNALINGEVTQEVKNLRWRTYLVIQASKGISTSIVGWEKDENGDDVPIMKSNTRNFKDSLHKVKVDEHDSYKLEMVVKNDFESLGIQDLKAEDTLEFSQIDFATMAKAEKPISVGRKTVSQFYIEMYAHKMNVRTIDETNKLLEFYVSKYADVNNRSSNLFLSEIRKIMEGKRSGILDINDVSFITYNTIGKPDFLQYEYQIDSFDKIIEHDGYYVIKYKAHVITGGENILEKYREEALDLKYHNKEKKKITV